METGSEAGEGGDVVFVSTGHLPSPEQVRRSVQEAYERYRTVAEGLELSVMLVVVGSEHVFVVRCRA
jgi:hypothetical protein